MDRKLLLYLCNMAFRILSQNRSAVYPVIVIVMLAAVICSMPNVDPMHSMARGCSVSNFLSALPLQNQSRIFFSFLLLVLVPLAFVYVKSAVKDNAASSNPLSIRAPIPKLFNYLTSAFSRGIIHSKIYAAAFSF